MTVALWLFAYAIAVAAATRLLRRPWVSRAPRLAIALWQLALLAVVGAATLGLLALAVPGAAGGGLADLLRACAGALRLAYHEPVGRELGLLLGVLAAAAVVTWISVCLAGELWRSTRWRRRHLDALMLLGRADDESGVVVVDHPTPAAYCIPGRAGRIVLTTAALTALDGHQLAGVLDHERAHLTQRHDLVLAGVRGLARAFPLPVFRAAEREVAALLEMLADDAASDPQQRVILATALLEVAAGSLEVPAGAFAAAGTRVATRVQRLVTPARPLPAFAAALTIAGTAGALLAPAVIAIAPAVAAAALPYCPLPVA